MYISGVPGTGKTATVREVARYLREAKEEGALPNFTFVEINGMRLTEPRQTYSSILKVPLPLLLESYHDSSSLIALQQLTGQQATPEHAASLLDDYFTAAHDTTTVLLADEVYTCTCVLYNVMYMHAYMEMHLHSTKGKKSEVAYPTVAQTNL